MIEAQLAIGDGLTGLAFGERPFCFAGPVGSEPSQDPIVLSYGEGCSAAQALEELPVSRSELSNSGRLTPGGASEFGGTFFEIATELSFHAPDRSRIFPIPSIGYFRVAVDPVASDISDMADFSLRDRLKERLTATGKAPVPLARELGRGRDFITDVLNGRKDTLPSDALTSLATALSCDERYFTDPDFTSPGRPRHAASPEQLERYRAAAGQFGAFTWAWREYRRLTLQDISDETGLSPGTVSDIETGLKAPSPEELERLAKALQTAPGLLRTNPFETHERVARLVSIAEDLDPSAQATLIDMAEALQRRAG